MDAALKREQDARWRALRRFKLPEAYLFEPETIWGDAASCVEFLGEGACIDKLMEPKPTRLQEEVGRWLYCCQEPMPPDAESVDLCALGTPFALAARDFYRA